MTLEGGAALDCSCVKEVSNKVLLSVLAVCLSKGLICKISPVELLSYVGG